MSRKIIRAESSGAHLCPPVLRGRKIWLVKLLRNHPWRVSIRLFSHRLVGEGKSSQGKLRATIIRGIPINVGLENWSKRLSVMVSFRGWF